MRRRIHSTPYSGNRLKSYEMSASYEKKSICMFSITVLLASSAAETRGRTSLMCFRIFPLALAKRWRKDSAISCLAKFAPSQARFSTPNEIEPSQKNSATSTASRLRLSARRFQTLRTMPHANKRRFSISGFMFTVQKCPQRDQIGAFQPLLFSHRSPSESHSTPILGSLTPPPRPAPHPQPPASSARAWPTPRCG